MQLPPQAAMAQALLSPNCSLHPSSEEVSLTAKGSQHCFMAGDKLIFLRTNSEGRTISAHHRNCATAAESISTVTEHM